ncbi:hypothetical protein BDA99DRAFT_540871 [Phascolomyces articulosus]|uniref:Uncharacterized protein n=1 Tax=Phascolomyces articulosus TaxID=60185 RepID=A0AAD5K2H9_9FUNG|nr:hypothetical protein BDA99DRAFT_540871 [Phascolomyces articulosus]
MSNVIITNCNFKYVLQYLNMIFETYQDLKPFLVKIKAIKRDRDISGYCKERSSLKDDDSQDDNCLHKNITFLFQKDLGIHTVKRLYIVKNVYAITFSLTKFHAISNNFTAI